MYNPNYEFSAPQGWVCPKCGRVMAPSQSYCMFCSNIQTNTVWASTTEGEKDFWRQYLEHGVTAEGTPTITLSDYRSRVDKWLERYSKIGDEDDEV